MRRHASITGSHDIPTEMNTRGLVDPADIGSAHAVSGMSRSLSNRPAARALITAPTSRRAVAGSSTMTNERAINSSSTSRACGSCAPTQTTVAASRTRVPSKNGSAEPRRAHHQIGFGDRPVGFGGPDPDDGAGTSAGLDKAADL